MSIVVEKLNTEALLAGYIVSVTINQAQEYIYGPFKSIEDAKEYALEMSPNFIVKIKQVHSPSIH